MLSHPQADAAIRRQHDLHLAAERRRLIRQASAQGEQVSWLARLRCATWRVGIAARASLLGVRSFSRADSRPGVLPNGTLIGG